MVILFLISSLISNAAEVALSQKDVAEMVLRQSIRKDEVNFTAQQSRLAKYEIEKAFDFNLTAESGYDHNQPINLANTANLKERSYKTSVKLKKPFATGTIITTEFLRNSQSTDLQSGTNTNQTQDTAGLTLEQNLLGNTFGRADRAKLRAADATYQASMITRVTSLQDLVLEAIGSYWDAYVAQETFQEALNARDRYKKLVDAVRKKSGYGYSSPGEFSQVQAELETREQNVKNQSTAYLKSLDSLVTLLNLPARTDVKFVLQDEIPPLPKLAEFKMENSRPIKAAVLKSQAAEDMWTAAKSYNLPNFSFVGKLYSTGVDTTPESSFSQMNSGTHPQYYLGVKLEYTFGSGYRDEDTFNKKITRDLAEAQLQRQRLEFEDKEDDISRRVQAAYAVAQSTKTQKQLREKAVQELTRGYNQGRTDISTLIEAMNKYFDSEVQFSRAIGDYHVALNEWAAIRDELIPDNGNQVKQE